MEQQQRGRGRPPKPLDPDASHAARLGAELRKRRQARGLTLKAFAGMIRYSVQHVSEVELAKASVSRAFVVACDWALEADGVLLDLLPAVVGERAMQRDERSTARRRAEGRDAPGYMEVQAVARAFGLERYAGLLYPSEVRATASLGSSAMA